MVFRISAAGVCSSSTLLAPDAGPASQRAHHHHWHRATAGVGVRYLLLKLLLPPDLLLQKAALLLGGPLELGQVRRMGFALSIFVEASD